MIDYAAAHTRQIQREQDTFWLSRLRKAHGMQYVNSIFGELLKPIDRRQFREIVERHDGDAYDKSFKSRDHLVTMVGAQLGGVTSLRGVYLQSKLPLALGCALDALARECTASDGRFRRDFRHAGGEE